MEYKFRAWSVRECRMVYIAHNELSSTHLQINNSSWGVFEPDEDEYCGGASMNIHFGDVLMMWTGQKDKNGKYIYDGDLLIIKDDEEIFEVKWDNETSRFVMESESLTVDFDNYYGYECEVIGNKYEDTHLLYEK